MIKHVRYPQLTAALGDLREAAQQFVLQEFATSQPLFTKADPIWAMGSCFAENIATALKSRGVPTFFNHVTEATNTPATLRAFFDAVTDKSSSYSELFPASLLEDARTFIPRTKGAVITLGVAAVAHSPTTGQLIKGTVYSDWRPMSVTECTEDIGAIIESLRAINPEMHIFLTLSPVPLLAAPWRPSAPVAADCISKSTLRVAIEQAMVAHRERVYYWPAFEIARWLGAHRADHFGADDGEVRHVSKVVVGTIVDLFIETWFTRSAD